MGLSAPTQSLRERLTNVIHGLEGQSSRDIVWPYYQRELQAICEAVARLEARVPPLSITKFWTDHEGIRAQIARRDRSG